MQSCPTYPSLVPRLDLPKLRELVNVLEDLRADEVRYLCIKLGVDQHTLDRIDTDNAAGLIRIPKYLDAWLDRDRQPSWEKIAEALHSKKLNKTVLARKITEKYSPRARCVSPLSPSLSPFSGAASSPCASEVSSSSSEADISSPTSRYMDTEPPSIPAAPHIALPILPVSEAKIDESRFHCITNQVFGLVKRFHSVINSAISDLTHKHMSSRQLSTFKLHITRLPMLSVKCKKLYFLQKKKRKIRRARSIQKVFDILDPYWNFADYSLLEHIVQKYCDQKVRKKMRKHIYKLQKFQKATSVKELTSVLQVARTPPKGYSTLTATLQVDAAKCSLYQVQIVKTAIAERACLEDYVLLLLDLHASYVRLVIAFPRAVSKYIKRSLDRDFLEEVGIMPDSLHFDAIKDKQAPSYKRLHIPDISRSPDLNEWRSHDQTSAMPDPPQNVTEEVYILVWCSILTFCVNTF